MEFIPGKELLPATVDAHGLTETKNHSIAEPLTVVSARLFNQDYSKLGGE